jgi:hypothetical protein
MRATVGLLLSLFPCLLSTFDFQPRALPRRYLFRLRNEVSDWKYQRNRWKFDVYINKHKGEPPSRPDRWVN